MAGFCCRVRLALLQGLSQLPGGASRADCLPPTEEGSLLSGFISCQLSVFFLCFCCSLRQTDGVGKPEKQDFQSGALSKQGTFTLGPASSGSIPLPRPSLLLWSGPVLSPNLPRSQLLSSWLASTYGNTTRQYPRPQDKAKLQTPGYDIQSPQKPDLCYFLPLTLCALYSVLRPGQLPHPSLPSSPSSNSPP